MRYEELEINQLTDQHLEIQAISTNLNQSLIAIINLYLPPASSCTSDHVLSGETVDTILGYSDGDLLKLRD